MNIPHWYPSAVAWTLFVAAWAYMFVSSRRRRTLMQKLSLEYAGFLNSRFFLATLVPEPVSLTFSRLISGVPVRFSIRYELPFRLGPAYPSTVFEFELDEAMFGTEGGSYTARDYLAGRGLFMGGPNLTADYARFVAETPHGRRFRLGWRGASAWLMVPGLLGEESEIWVRHCLKFMEELAQKVGHR